MSSPILPSTPPMALPGIPGDTSGAANAAAPAINASLHFSTLGDLKKKQPALYKAIEKGMGMMMMRQMKAASDAVVKTIKEEEQATES